MKPVAVFVLFVLSAAVQSSAGVVYKVGDSNGWTVGKTNYNEWASTKTFRVGDTIVFVYSPKAHNVVEVKRKDYDSCNFGSPIRVYSSGNDSIAIKTTGHYYYICGVPGHCNAGQKVDIRVPKSDSAPPSAPSAAPVSAPPPGGSSGSNSSAAQPPAAPAGGGSNSSVPAPAPKESGAPRSHKGVGFALAALAVAGISGFIMHSV